MAKIYQYLFFTSVILAALWTVSSAYTHEEMTEISRLMDQLGDNNLMQTCTKCTKDIYVAVKDCMVAGLSPQNMKKCIQDALLVGSDCILCICKLVGSLSGVSIEQCKAF